MSEFPVQHLRNENKFYTGGGDTHGGKLFGKFGVEKYCRLLVTVRSMSTPNSLMIVSTMTKQYRNKASKDFAWFSPSCRLEQVCTPEQPGPDLPCGHRQVGVPMSVLTKHCRGASHSQFSVTHVLFTENITDRNSSFVPGAHDVTHR